MEDSVIADPQFTVTLPGSSGHSLCYEVHGDADKHFNLISDVCTSVNTHYTPMPLNPTRNRMSSIGIHAVSGGPEGCVDIEIHHQMCRAVVQGRDVNISVTIGDINVRKVLENRWRVSVPNCARPGLVMWVTCMSNRLRFDVTRGSNLRPTSHGLLGETMNECCYSQGNLLAPALEYSCYCGVSSLLSMFMLQANSGIFLYQLERPMASPMFRYMTRPRELSQLPCLLL